VIPKDYLRVFLVLVLAIGMFQVGRWAVRSTLTATEPTGTAPLASRSVADGDTELVLVLIVSSTCDFCADPRLPSMVGEARDSITQLPERVGAGSVMSAVAVDSDVPAGLAFLQRFGSFDEVVAGRGWLSSGLFELVWADHPGPAKVPQVVLLRRSIRMNPKRILGRETEVLHRAVGLEGINRWKEGGYQVAG